MMSVLYAAERDPEILAKTYAYTGDTPTLRPEYPSELQLVPGTAYTLSDLIARMIQGSDNAAAVLIYNAIGQKAVDKTFHDIGFYPPMPGRDYELTVHQYSMFFRILYNSTYLTYGDSERALGILSKIEFKDGIVAGVPSTVTVAHKFGERELGDVNQLHDCGIVYATDKPYILCIMTRGLDIKKLAHIVEDISRIVYTNVNNQ
jgi:beta-lactamase class A